MARARAAALAEVLPQLQVLRRKSLLLAAALTEVLLQL